MKKNIIKETSKRIKEGINSNRISILCTLLQNYAILNDSSLLYILEVIMIRFILLIIIGRGVERLSLYTVLFGVVYGAITALFLFFKMLAFHMLYLLDLYLYIIY